jgi:D-alanyl-D-alanine carboxypeptidase (penicillin-binding protein 5/6)
MFLAVKSEVRVEDLIRGLVIQSGNDAAITLAEGLAGSEDAFAAMMNKRAAELGMTHSHFVNPWGKGDPEQRVTARDMARLASYIIREYPEYYKYFGEKEFTWNKIRQLNRNPLLTMDIGADGLKTGDLAESGYGLVGSAVQNGQRLIVVINGLKTASERAEEARKLFNWGFRAFDPRVLFQPGDTVASAEVYGGAKGEVEITCDKAAKIFVPHGSTDRLSAKLVYTGPLVAPVAAGVEIGRLEIYRGAVKELELPARTKEAVALGGLTQRALDAALELAAGLFRKAWAKN